MALKKAGLKVELREVRLSDLPEQLTELSPKSTVPVLLLPNGIVFDESWDIVKWALQQSDPDNWLGDDDSYLPDAEMLIEINDFSFKSDLDHYKYADRHPEHSQQYYREACEEFIEELEEALADHAYLLADQVSLADIGVFPFVRQFAMVDKEWFDQAPYPKVQHWLASLIDTELFQHIFQKHELWQAGDPAIYV